VPLTSLVLHFLHSCFKHISTSITASGKLCVITRATIDPVSLGSELFIYQACPAFVAEETSFMPVFLFVRKILRVNADNLATLIAVVSKHIFITLDTVRMVISQDIPVASKAVITMMAEHGFNFYFLVVTVFRTPGSKLSLASQY